MIDLTILGQVAEVANGVAQVVNAGQVAPVQATPGKVLMEVSEADLPKVKAFVASLQGGPKGPVVCELYPHLPSKAVDGVLGLADDLTAAVLNDGVITGPEYLSAGMRSLTRVFA